MMTRMTFEAALVALAATGAASAGAAQAQERDPTGTRAESPVVVERGDDGRATAVRIGGTVYPVCASEGQDGYIQPRAAGLGWGDRPLQRWPGRPASQMRSPTSSADRKDR